MRSILPTLALAALAAAGAAPAGAQTYPDRLIKIVVPFTPGGPVDIVARLIAQRMALSLRQSVIVENRVGGGGAIGAKAVASAEPDGYTLLFGNVSTLAVLPAVTQNRDYDPTRNFVAVAKVSDSPELLIVDPAFPARSVGELVAYAKAHPGQLNYGSSGYGNATHLAAEWFKAKTGTDIVHIPYKGLSDIVPGLIGGQVIMAFGAIEGLLPLVQGGKLRPLAVVNATGRECGGPQTGGLPSRPQHHCGNQGEPDRVRRFGAGHHHQRRPAAPARRGRGVAPRPRLQGGRGRRHLCRPRL